jgi:hypothetical protein
MRIISSSQNYKQCESCGVAWKNLASAKCGRCMTVSSVVEQSIPADSKLFHLPFCFSEIISSLPDTQSLARAAIETSRASRSQSMEARLTKQPLPAPTLHTTTGLMSAKDSMTTGENKIFIKVECRIKSQARKDQKTTDFDCGQWGKPWSKDVFLSGKSLLRLIITTFYQCWFLLQKFSMIT